MVSARQEPPKDNGRRTHGAVVRQGLLQRVQIFKLHITETWRRNTAAHKHKKVKTGFHGEGTPPPKGHFRVVIGAQDGARNFGHGVPHAEPVAFAAHFGNPSQSHE